MTTLYSSPTLTMNIKRQYFADILALPRRKWIEYREIKDYWLRRLEPVEPAPFNLRLIHGMTKPCPEATIRVTKVRRNHRTRELEFHLGRILSVKHWDRKREIPTK